MEGWITCVHRLCDSDCPAPVVAAALSFGFVFIHPFLDGNGRLHRLLIHEILARMGFTPEGVVFPVSAAILRREQEYDRILEAVSEPLLPMIDYELGARGDLTVKNDTAHLYRYLDYTRFADYLYQCIERTLEKDFPEELATLQRYDRTRAALREIVDMPDRKLDLLIRFLWQNGGKLSSKKRAKFFPELTDEEVAAMEKVNEPSH